MRIFTLQGGERDVAVGALREAPVDVREHCFGDDVWGAQSADEVARGRVLFPPGSDVLAAWQARYMEASIVAWEYSGARVRWKHLGDGSSPITKPGFGIANLLPARRVKAVQQGDWVIAPPTESSGSGGGELRMARVAAAASAAEGGLPLLFVAATSSTVRAPAAALFSVPAHAHGLGASNSNATGTAQLGSRAAAAAAGGLRNESGGSAGTDKNTADLLLTRKKSLPPP